MFVVLLLCIVLCIVATSYGFQKVPHPGMPPSIYHGRKGKLSMLPIADIEGKDLSECLSSLNFDVVKYTLAGASAGGLRALSRSLTYPLDTIKTLQQTKEMPEDLKEKDLLRGVVATIIAAIPANAVFYVVYNALEQFSACYSPIVLRVENPSEVSKLLRRIVFSTIATIPQNGVKIPAELIKQRAQVSDKSVSIQSIIVQAMDEGQGPLGLYVGSGAQLLREIPYNAFQMAFFDLLKDSSVSTVIHTYLSASFEFFGSTAGALTVQVLDEDAVAAALLGCIAAAAAAVFTQPADVIKTSIMAYPVSLTLTSERKQPTNTRGSCAYAKDDKTLASGETTSTTGTATRTGQRKSAIIPSSDRTDDTSAESIVSIDEDNNDEQSSVSLFMRVVRDIYATEGIAGFFVGLVPRLLIVSIGGAVYFFAATLVQDLL
mmetsp:Transcript_31597/g.53325  ORF Transcript_31597/g.53325 Transcript_31597/m.53325 type:complete len:432 (+) Transcript_31597:51-1346(+)